METANTPQPKKQKTLLFITVTFVALVAYFTIDIMLQTNPPWKKKKLIPIDSTQNNRPIDSFYLTDFKDSIIYTYRVSKNEVLSKIAEKFNMSIDSIKALNQLDGDKIIENQKLKVRIRALHRVKQGETIEKIAKQYGLLSQQVIEANKIKNPKQLWADQVIVIPIPRKN